MDESLCKSDVAGCQRIHCLAAADYAYQRWNYTKQLRMSKQEVMDDLKRSEGDPFLRGRIRQQQRRMAQSRMMTGFQSGCDCTNPTHFAVAIIYESNKWKLYCCGQGAFNVANEL